MVDEPYTESEIEAGKDAYDEFVRAGVSAATLQHPRPRVRCPRCGNDVGTRSNGRLRSHVRKIEPTAEPCVTRKEYELCSGSGCRP